jgi:hypothetical protein
MTLIATKEILAALRTATTAAFYCTEKDRNANLRLERALKDGIYHAKAEQDVSAICTFRCYGKVDGEPRQSRYYHKAHFSLLWARQEGPWKALVSLLRVGDELAFHIDAYNNTEAMEAAGFNAHELHARVFRQNKEVAGLLLTYHIDQPSSWTAHVSAAEVREEAEAA